MFFLHHFKVCSLIVSYMCGLYVWSCFTHIPSPTPKTAPLCVPSTSRSPCFCLSGAGIKGVHHHTWFFVLFLSNLLSPINIVCIYAHEYGAIYQSSLQAATTLKKNCYSIVGNYCSYQPIAVQLVMAFVSSSPICSRILTSLDLMTLSS